MAGSILDDTKKMLGIAADYTVFDIDILTNINGAFSTLTQLGLGPADGFIVEDNTVQWEAFIGSNKVYSSVKMYVFLKSKLGFDPPTTSFHLEALNAQLLQLEWRLNVERENKEWIDPNPPETP